MHLKQRYAHLQVILSIGGTGSADTYPIVASNAILRDNFARAARGLVEASGLDGIDSAALPRPRSILHPPSPFLAAYCSVPVTNDGHWPNQLYPHYPDMPQS